MIGPTNFIIRPLKHEAHLLKLKSHVRNQGSRVLHTTDTEGIN